MASLVGLSSIGELAFDSTTRLYRLQGGGELDDLLVEAWSLELSDLHQTVQIAMPEFTERSAAVRHPQPRVR